MTCSTALTKLTWTVYQTGVDRSKHSDNTLRDPAITTLWSNTAEVYANTGQDWHLEMVKALKENAPRWTDPYTSLKCLWVVSSPSDKVRKT